MHAVSRKSSFKAAGRNDVWFAVFCIAAVVIVSLLANASHTNAPERPTAQRAPVPAPDFKD